ncbi:tetratricopeptide repeat protein [Paraliomyxa miuraensis]|uniref:tetratricopeptide repeat protein n=1 Tax=Paraliomyxa miuraensis TaxID=376150 RepID=UPI0022586903|nr:tetratricopeptide repeat protein [Paraliomyxa miuraensis]MCX4239357.1 tetratricopeptide repeat protein [Paraliomyxa miuraensis]
MRGSWVITWVSPLCGWLLLGWLWAGGGAAAVAAPPPDDGKGLPGVDDEPSGTLPRPPDAADDDGGAETDGGEPQLTEQQKFEMRQRIFDEHLRKAQAAQRKDRHHEALREFSAALELQPGDPAALLGRAESRKAKTPPGRCPRQALGDLMALETYDPKGTWIEQRGVALQWMGLCGSSHAKERLALATVLAVEDPGAPGRPDDVRAVVAELQVAAAERSKDDGERELLRAEALAELERYRKECEAHERAPVARALRLRADILHANDDIAGAIEAYQALLAAHAGAPETKGASEIIDKLEFESSLRDLEKTQGFRPDAVAEAAYDRGEAALRAGDLATAERELHVAIEQSPWFPRAYHLRGVVLARTGRFLEAVEDLKRAIQMDRSDYQAQMTLGLIYKKEFAGAEDEQAIEHLEAALRLRPDLHRLHLLLGELYARTDRELAREHYSDFLELSDADDPEAQQAARALAELEREIRRDEPLAIPPPPEKSLLLLDPKLQHLINTAYLQGTEHQDWKGAEKVLLRARDEFPDEPEVLNQLARVVYAQQREGDARRYWEQSLQKREDQAEVHERLGLLLRSALPDEAIPHLERAAELRSLTARFALAELLWEQNQPLEASRQLDLYLAEAGDYDLHWDRAQALRQEIDARFFQFYLAAGVVLTLIIVVPAWRIHRHYRGASLAQLLEREPKSFPEVARILSLIRHEILKHNTAFLADVGRALELDAPDADQRAAVLAQRMFGDGSGIDDRRRRDTRDRRGRVAGGIYGRFLGYVSELEQVARAHRVTLNLYRKDPIFRPMIKAFEELASRSAQLRRPERLRSGDKLELAKVLGRTGNVLGRQAFERLSGVIRELCVVDVDGVLVQEVYDQVAGEEQFVGHQLAPLTVMGEGGTVRIFRTDFEDILANVLRNSLRSSVLYARPPVGLGIDLGAEVDEITGLSSVVIRVMDRSPEPLSTEMLRGRYVERGMGITVDLLSRYDGAISVESAPGWSKAVVLRFFTVEDEAITGVAA